MPCAVRARSGCPDSARVGPLSRAHAGIPDSSRLPQLGALDVRSRRARDCELHSCQVNVGDYSRSVASACLHTFQKRAETLAKKTPRVAPRGKGCYGKEIGFITRQRAPVYPVYGAFPGEIRGKSALCRTATNCHRRSMPAVLGCLSAGPMVSFACDAGTGASIRIGETATVAMRWLSPSGFADGWHDSSCLHSFRNGLKP